MATVLTLEEAKRHLGITDAWHDADVQAKLNRADGIVRQYLKAQNDPLWDDTTAPESVKASVELMLGHLDRHRGDEWGPTADTDDRVWEAIANLLRQIRDPALA